MADKCTVKGIYNLRTIIERFIKCVKNMNIYILSVSLTLKRLSIESNMRRFFNA